MRRDAEVAATLRAMTKIVSLVNGAAGYHLQIERELIEAKTHTGRHMAPWQVMTPRIGKPFEIEIIADDLVVFIKSRNFDYVSEVLHVVSLYNSMIYGFVGYSERRERLGEHMTLDDLNGLLGGANLGREQYLRVAPYLLPVIQLAEHLRREAKEVYEAATRIGREFRPIVQT